MDPDYANNGPFGSDQFFRAVTNLARWNNTWSTYSSWFNTNDSAAWSERRTDYNITHNDISTATPATGDISGMETESPMVYRQVTQIQDIAVPFTFSGNYEILNVGSNLALTIAGGVNTNNAAVVQEAYTAGPHELWNFVATSGGYYHIINNASGLALNVTGNQTASFQEGAELIQYTAAPIKGGDGNDEWMPVLNSDGSYTFYNMNSEQVLDNHAASTAAGNQQDQWFANGTTAQKFTLIAH